MKQLFGEKRVFLHAIVQAICFKMPVRPEKGVFLQACVQAISFKMHVKKLKFCPTCYCTDNMLQNACEKIKFLSNSFWVQKDVFLYACVQCSSNLQSIFKKNAHFSNK
jgi:hypothetical protein